MVCGEYGETNARPHYHALIFGWRPDDAIPYRNTSHGVLYTSDSLSSVWGLGFVSFGDVQFSSAAYVARYSMKKVTGKEAASYYYRPHPVTGEFHQVRPEFMLMSRRPGIGADWFTRYRDDAFPSDFLVHEGRKVGVPRFYKSKLTEEEQEQVTAKRRKDARKRAHDNTPERLAVREQVQLARLALLKRDL